jgi:hypothetical protein
VCLVESDEAVEELGKKRDSRDVGARVISVASRPRFGCLGESASGNHVFSHSLYLGTIEHQDSCFQPMHIHTCLLRATVSFVVDDLGI